MKHLRFPYRGAGIGLVCHGCLLMGKRSKKPFLGLWAVPGGGREKGEAYLDCAKRELFEETGCNLDLLKPYLICSWTLAVLPFFKWTTFFYKLDSFDAELKASEFSELEWVPLEKVKARKCRPFTGFEIRKLKEFAQDL